MGTKRDTANENKVRSCGFRRKIKKIMELTTETHKTIIETLKATVKQTNKELRKTNANPSQLWATATYK